MNMKLFGHSNYLLAGFESGQLVLFDLRSYDELDRADLFQGQPLMCFDYNESRNIGMAGSAEMQMLQFQIKTNENNCSNILEKTAAHGLTNPGKKNYITKEK